MALDNESFDILLATVQRFVRERLIPAENHLEEHDEVPPAIVDEMKAMGLFGLTVPEEYGGIGLSVAQEVKVNFELGRTAPAFRSVFGTNIGIGSQGILMDGTPEQKAQYLPRVASGELVMSFALTEPDAGSDAASLKTTARPDGDHYVLNGTKRYITNAPRAGAFTLMARTGGPGAAGVSAFIVPADLPGITLGKKDRKMGQRGTMTCDVILENVRVPAANIIGGVAGRGFKTAMKVLDRGRLNISAVACGIAQRVLDESVRYARERRQFGKPLADFQLIQAMLADSQAELRAGWALVQDVARRFDAKPPHVSDPEVSMLVSCAKLFCTEMAGRVADRGVQVHGGAGYINEYPVERFYRDVRLLRLYEGASQIQQIVIARELTRHD
ncbi:acyl-CoA dehydrogenase family protein [Calidifontimicrobium sp. SYSU G02091]|uniref:acyl-CoA dehydrogenase family protein n=1 Tax=Calidifontimicrobium sp. SYSU G02091 TaxID=2926421 RepID=UPI001F53812C|nr:acyl-CoA dehydrogenase family protein [Calidifontimicrobium sp. SYSU G02091]MCI1193604.1 acyl-CoA dehydrogenase family protein [Calidifontimicrobium sp. SYSU G02091]